VELLRDKNKKAESNNEGTQCRVVKSLIRKMKLEYVYVYVYIYKSKILKKHSYPS
jgi:hypothetical protein